MKRRTRLRPLDLILVLLIGLPLAASRLHAGATATDITVFLPPPPDPDPVVALIHRQSTPDATGVAQMVEEAVEAVLGPAGLAALVYEGDTVLIKINLPRGYLETHQTTDWQVVAPLTQMAWAAGAGRVIIGEGGEVDFEGAGYTDHMPAGTEFVDLDRVTAFYNVTVEGGYWSEPILIPQVYVDADVVISVPALKTHSWAGVTLGLKNAVGVPPVEPYSAGTVWRMGLHYDYGIHRTIAQINLARKPDLVVVDALQGCEGQGPWRCTAVPMNLIMAALDPVAVDTVGTAIVGCDYCQQRRIAHLEYAAYKNLGIHDLDAIQVVGASIAQVQQAFAMPAEAKTAYRATAVLEAAATPPGVDGDLNEWRPVRTLVLDEAGMVHIGRNCWDGPADLSATAQALYDEENLYLAVQVRDDTVRANSAASRLDGDGIELYINGREPRDVAFDHLTDGDDYWLAVAYGPSPVVWDVGRDRAVADAEAAVAETADGYGLELRLPWRSLDGFEAMENRQIGFDLALNDDDSGGGRETWLSWGAFEAPAQPPGDPAEWGVALLGAEQDLAAPSITVRPPALEVSEPDGTARFTLALTARPTATVTIGLSAAGGQCRVPASAVLDGISWEDGVEVTVEAVDDDVADGDQVCLVQTAPASSADGRYHGLNPADVTVTVRDDDQAGVDVSPRNVDVAEGGRTDGYQVVLTSQPGEPVTISTILDGQTTVQPATPLTFDALDWRIARLVTVTAVDDARAEGIHTGTIRHQASSADPDYDGIDVPVVTARIQDNDLPGVAVYPTSLSIQEPSGAAVFTVALTMRPVSTVTVALEPDNGECTVSPLEVMLDGGSWRTGVQVTVTAVDDQEPDGDQICIVRTRPASSQDPDYDGLDPEDVTATVGDDDAAYRVYLPLAWR